MEVAHNLNRTAFTATLHCLTGCSIGEVLGMVLGTGFGWSNAVTIVCSVILAFFFGYSLTLYSLIRAGVRGRTALSLAFASDTVSIAVMEIVDNAIVVLIPGALNAGLGDPLFWGSLALSLAIAFCVAFPVNRLLISRGRGHAVVHAYHGHHSH
jgi:hypothetical protein